MRRAPRFWPALTAPWAACRARILDTGSAHHLCSRKDIIKSKLITEAADEAILLATANGIITANIRAKYFDGNLGITLDPLVLDNSPEVVSIGRLTEEGDHEFIWPNWRSGQPPSLRNVVNGDRTARVCVQDFVPYLVDQIESAPSAAVNGDMPSAHVH